MDQVILCTRGGALICLTNCSRWAPTGKKWGYNSINGPKNA